MRMPEVDNTIANYFVSGRQHETYDLPPDQDLSNSRYLTGSMFYYAIAMKQLTVA